MKVIVVYSFKDDELKSLANRMCMYIRSKYDIVVEVKSLESLGDDLYGLRKVSIEAIQERYASTYFLGICKKGDSTESYLASVLKSASIVGRSTYIHGVEKLTYFKRGSKALDTLHTILDFFIKEDASVSTPVTPSEITEEDFEVGFEAIYMGDTLIEVFGKDFMKDIPEDFIVVDGISDKVPCKYAIMAKFTNKLRSKLPIYFEMVSISNDKGCWLSVVHDAYLLDCRDVVNDYYNLALLSFTFVPYIQGQFCDSIFTSNNKVKFKVNGKEFEKELVIVQN